MSQNVKEKVQVVELLKDDASLPKLKYKYITSSYLDLSIRREGESWKIELTLKPLEKTLEKKFESELFREHVEEPRVFAAELEGKQVAWIRTRIH